MDHSSITYYGRQEFLDNGGVQLNFQSGFEVIFTGTSAAVGIEVAGSASEYMYSIDGEAFIRVLNPTAGYNSLATGLAAGEHTLTFYACNQGARNRITGLRFDSGASLKKVPKKKTIEFIGDSITAGWIGSGYINWLSKCYTWQTAHKLGFGFNVVARGGIGLLVKGTDALNMSDRYFRAIPYSETIGKNETYPMYDTSRYTPDYIVVNLGTNDRSYSSSQVQAAYTNFLTALRSSYPDATIFALRPLGGRDITGGDGYFKKEIISAVNARRTRPGGSRSRILPISCTSIMKATNISRRNWRPPSRSISTAAAPPHRINRPPRRQDRPPQILIPQRGRPVRAPPPPVRRTGRIPLIRLRPHRMPIR